MDSARTVYPTFAPAQYALTVTKAGTGTGTVNSTPAGINCGTACSANMANGASVTLTATADTGFVFQGWTGACTGLTNPCTVAMNAVKSITATFGPPTTTYLYDANGNLTQVTDPLGKVRKATYDALDRPYLVQEPHATFLGSTQGQITTGYDGQSQVASVQDPRSLTTTYTVDGLGNLLTLVSPDTGTTTHTYDEAGNLKTRTDARGKLSTYSYDALNRLTQASYGDQTVTLTWDSCTNGRGRLCRIDDGSGSTVYTYDAQGWVTGKTQTLGTVSLATGYGYNGAGQLTGLTTPASQTITYEWTGGKVSAIRVNGALLVSGIEYEPFGPLAAWTWANGQTMTRDFDLAGRPVAYSLGRTSTGAADARSLTYDGAGRIRSVLTTATPSLDQAHDYDGLDRLNATRLGNPVISTLAFSYDLSGNRSSQTLNGSITTYTTPASSNRLQSLSGAQVKSFGYDTAGNQTTSGSLTYGYDNAGRRTTATIAGQSWSYAYSALGERVKKAGPGQTTLYTYDLQGHLLGEYDGTGTLIQETVWLGDTPVATLRRAVGVTTGPASPYYVHADHLNTPRRITRPSDNKPVWQWESAPFGDTPADQNPAGLGAFVFNLRFPGQVYDAESGTHYNYFRDYDPGIGRYVESDPIGLAGGINTYSYVGGNPLSFTDPEGLVADAPGWCQFCHTPPPPVYPGNPNNNGGPMPKPDPTEAAPGNQVDTAIQMAYNNYASNARMNCPNKDPDDRCTWLKDNAQYFPAAAVKATAKAWGCRGSRWSGGNKF
jgi:RHS repeat-associated protein